MPPRSRWISLTLALVAASCFALAMQLAWWAAGEVTFGPFGTHSCFGGECTEKGLAWTGGSSLWMRSSVALRAAGYISMFALIVLAAGIAAKRVPKLAAQATIVSILTAIASGIAFLVLAPAVPSAAMQVGPPLLGIAIVSGVAACVVVLRSPRPARV